MQDEISDEKLEEIDEITEMISEGEEGTTSQGTKVIQMSEEEMKRRDAVDLIMSFFSYFVIAPLLILIISTSFSVPFWDVVDVLVALIPVVVIILVMKGVINVITHEPWHDVMRTPRYHKGRMWYKWWRWFE